MSPLRLVLLLLCVLLPLSGLAQAPEPGAAPSLSTPPPPLVPAQQESGMHEWRPYRLPLQFLGGSVGIGVGMLLTVGIVSLDSMDCDGPCSYPLIFFALGLGAGGITLGPTLAVWGIGEALEDRGRFWPTLGGAALGALSSFIVQRQLSNSNNVSTAAVIAIVSSGPLLGTLVAYELTRRGPLPSEPEASRFQVLPVAGMSPGGGLIGGLAGRF